MLRKGKGKSKTTCFLVDGKFINTDSDITNMSADHFETLGQPTIDNSYNESLELRLNLLSNKHLLTERVPYLIRI